jgi:indolepyruvate ferredoxin oxidoreductase, beta subunit
MSTTNGANRPITMAVLAMGGEGGGVFADWAVDMAEENGYWAQTTSVPGVAQRTGATIYYLEFFPRTSGSSQEPILSTMPTPGEVDIVVASELMEAGRAVMRGFVTPNCTTLITSTNRMYAMAEKTGMGDARVSSEELLSACKSGAKRLIADDFAQIAEESGTVISASLFGALAGSQILPFSKSEFISAIERGGVGVKASLAAFEKSYEVAQKAGREPSPTAVSIEIGKKPLREGEVSQEEIAQVVNDPQSAVGPALKELAVRIKEELPAEVRFMAVGGIKKCADYQDVAYAKRYLDRLATILDRERSVGDGTFRVLNEVARYCALWMTYEDTIRVAQFKTRKSRFERVEKEARKAGNQIVQVREFLHPGVEEFTDMMPTALGGWVLKTKPVTKMIERMTVNGIRLQTTSLHGYLLLYTMSRLRFLRPRSLRFSLEQERIDRWLNEVNDLMGKNYQFALEVAEIAGIIKGYGSTHANGLRNYLAIMDEVVRLKAEGSTDGAARIKSLHAAALADENGEKLRDVLALR